ncbi:Putative pentatricopeptide repeat-containing protein [Striga hermonthica]|uniref:Pentatricopeptide repeat-containing protein n=1 Tax=Striga hermonthica TaxID=68872 RepID=A0A9N7RDY6_STRHE|nr:Putative pentatricopeptide repeat-containing protein [Striga hermonthica]
MKPLHLLNKTTLSELAVHHCQAIKLSLTADTYASNNLISRYSKCRDLTSALKLFDDMPHRDIVSWNTIIAGYVSSNDFPRAWETLKSMREQGLSPDGHTLASTLKGVAAGACLMCCRQIHSDIIKQGYCSNVYAASALLDVYAKCGRVEDADRVFRSIPAPNKISWNALISGYVEVGNLSRCLELFSCMEMEEAGPDDATFAPILTLLREVRFYGLVMQLHGKITKRGLELENTVLNALITAYAESGCVDDAKRVFDGADGYRDLVTWNAMLAAYLEGGSAGSGFSVFLEMVRLGLKMDAYTYSSMINACSGDLQLGLGKSLHGLVIKLGLDRLVQISNVLISMYLKCNGQAVEDALRVFEKTDTKDVVTWNTILTGLSQKGLSETCMKVFQKMHIDCMAIEQYAFAAVLRSCSDLATLLLGQQVHVLVVKSGLEGNEYVASALIFMYSKCGILDDCLKSFETSRMETSVTWNSIIFAYAQHGQGGVALDFFYLMVERKVSVDHITFVAALTACSHVGLVDEGLKILKSMETEHKIPARMENYACAVDLLGRAGRLVEAEELVREMAFEPDCVIVLKTLLGACRACGDIQLATRIGGRLLEMDPGDHCTYILLSDMYGNLRRWDEKASVKRLMREKGVKKVPGWSWIELGHNVHAFNANDHSHPECRRVYRALQELTGEIGFCENSLILDDVPLDDMC